VEITLKVAGAKPQLLASIGAADPRSWAYQRMQELRKVKSANRTAKWYDEMEQVQFASSFYVIPDIKGVALPAENLRRSLVEAAKATRDKPKVLRAVKCVEVAVPLMYDGWENHWTPDDLWLRPEFRLTKMQRSSSGASPNTWPRFDPWGLHVRFDVDEEFMGEEEFYKLADRAGRIEGLGASRSQGYGRYAVVRPGKGQK